VINRKKDIDKSAPIQGAEAVISEPNKIGASTPYDFQAKNLTAYGGLLPVATMLEKLGFQQLVEETLTVKRVTRAMPMCQFVLAIVLAIGIEDQRQPVPAGMIGIELRGALYQDATGLPVAGESDLQAKIGGGISFHAV